MSRITISCKIDDYIDRELKKLQNRFYFRSKSSLIEFILRKAVGKPLEIITEECREAQRKVMQLQTIKDGLREVIKGDDHQNKTGLELRQLLPEK